MDRNDVMLSIASISTPGIWFGDNDQGRRLARYCNEYGARMKQDYPNRFGMFAALPLADVEGSLREIENALDVLKLDGVGMMTSYGEQYPGDPAFAPVFEELNRRGTVVYFHPTAPTCTPIIPGVPVSLLEFPTDTARAVTSLMFNGTFSRCPDIRFIFSHCGGTLLMIAARLVGNLERPALREVAARIPKGPMHELQRLYFDTASAATPIVFGAVTKLVPVSQILFGTDFPYWPISHIATALGRLGLSPADLRAIERDNALRLFPQYAGATEV